MQSALSYYITHICSVTLLQALYEAISPIWFNVNIDHISVRGILFSAKL